MLLRKTLFYAAIAVFCGSLSTTVSAQESATLAKVKQDGVIVLGYRESSIPWSYVDSKTNEVVGYSREISLQVIEDIKQRLNMPDLKVRQIPITAQNRISLMQNGTIDLECNGTSNNAERRKQVSFSNTIAITATQLLVRKNSGITSIEDLAGKAAVVTAGSTSERYLRRYVQEHSLNVNVVSARDHSQSFIMLQTGRAAAFFMDRDVLSALLTKAKDADSYELTGEPQTKEALACMFRKDDPEFKALVDETVARMHTSGDTEKLYKKWFLSPIPPDSVVLKTPLSDSMKELFANPNDVAYQ